MGFFTKAKKDKKQDREPLNEINDAELLDLEDEILSETGGGNSPNIGCGVVDGSDGSS